MAQLLTGGQAVFSIPNYATPPPLSLLGFAILGIAAGLLGVAFNRALLYTLDAFQRLRPWAALALASAVGAAIGLVGWFTPDLIGGGHGLTELALAGKIGLAVIPLYLVLRFLMTASSYGTGAAGGIFAPMLAIGALLGLGVGELFRDWLPRLCHKRRCSRWLAWLRTLWP